MLFPVVLVKLKQPARLDMKITGFGAVTSFLVKEFAEIELFCF